MHAWFRFGVVGLSALVFACSGSDGSDGATGATGSQGAIGATGATGATGDAGAAGATGATGATGDAGETGADGAKGDTGDTGAAGPTSEIGRARVVTADDGTGAMVSTIATKGGAETTEVAVVRNGAGDYTLTFTGTYDADIADDLIQIFATAEANLTSAAATVESANATTLVIHVYTWVSGAAVNSDADLSIALSF